MDIIWYGSCNGIFPPPRSVLCFICVQCLELLAGISSPSLPSFVASHTFRLIIIWRKHAIETFLLANVLGYVSGNVGFIGMLGENRWREISLFQFWRWLNYNLIAQWLLEGYFWSVFWWSPNDYKPENLSLP